MPSFQPPRPTGTPPISLRDTGGEDCKVAFSLYAVLQPPRNATGHGRGGEIAAQSVPLAAFFQPLRPSDTSPIFCCAKHRGGVHLV